MQPVSGLEVEVMLFVQAILAGAGLFLVYDVLRVIRRIFVHGIIWVSIEDALYWMISGFWIFLRICRLNDGIIRGYMLVAGLAGAALYYAVFSRPLMFRITKIIHSAKKQLKKMKNVATIRRDKRKATKSEKKNEC